MVSNSNKSSMTKKIQNYIVSFCQLFFIFSLPSVLYLEIYQRLYPETEWNFQSSIFFPPNTTTLAYSFYVFFTVSAFMVLCLVNRAEVIHNDGQLVSRSTLRNLENFESEHTDEDPVGPDGDDMERFKSEYLVTDGSKPTSGPLIWRAVVVLDLMFCAFFFPNLPSFFLLLSVVILMFLPLGRATFNLTCFVMVPLTFLYFIFFYIINLNELYPTSWEKEYPWLLHKFEEPALEILIIFTTFASTCKLNSFRGSFDLNYFQRWE